MPTPVRICLLLAATTLLIGCGPGSTPVPPPKTTPTEAIQRDLEYIVEHNTVGSEMMTIQDNIEKLKETDPDKAAKLEAQAERLSHARRGQAAPIAKKMLKDL